MILQPVVDSFIDIIARIKTEVQTPGFCTILNTSTPLSAGEPIRRQHEVLMTEEPVTGTGFFLVSSCYRKCIKLVDIRNNKTYTDYIYNT